MDDILAIGQSIFSEEDLLELRQEGIQAIVNLQEGENYTDYDLSAFHYHHLPIRDFSVPDADTIQQFLVTVQHHFERGEPVYVHCTAGCGRSGTMVGIWLATLGKWDTVDDLVAHLRSLRPCAIETEEQLELVGTYLKIFSD